jgi:hypothetical protein
MTGQENHENPSSIRVGGRRSMALPSSTVVVGVVSILTILSHVRRLLHEGIIAGDDFRFYWAAGRRFFANPMTLYDECHDLRGFLYPPASIALFLPFAHLPQLVGGLAFRAVSLLAMVACAELTARLFELAGMPVSTRDRALLACVMVAMGPTYTNFAYGQVNTLVLLDCLAFRWMLERRRPAFAGAILALGSWLKIYPVLCLLWVVLWERHRYDARRAVLAFAAVLVAVPALLLPLVPAGLYRIFLTDVLPATTGRTFQGVLDQSLVAAAARRSGPILDYVVNFYDSVIPPAWARVLNALVAIGGVVVVGRWVRDRAPQLRLASFLCLLSLVPVVSPLGWAYVYVMALPALLFALRRASGVGSQALVLVACAAYLVPATHPLAIAAHLPDAIGHVVYDRYLFAALAVSALILWQASRGAPRCHLRRAATHATRTPTSAIAATPPPAPAAVHPQPPDDAPPAALAPPASAPASLPPSAPVPHERGGSAFGETFFVASSSARRASQ